MAKYNKGDHVQDINDSTKYGTVEKVFPLEGGEQYYQVLWPYPCGLTSVWEEDISPFNPDRGPDSDFISSSFSGHEDFLRFITVNRLSKGQPIKNTLYAFNASRTRFYPYQFKPLVKFLDSERYRVLICDEVGLGKTIEAGLILVEFKARFTAKKILITCPSGLRKKWKDEMKNRFDEEFTIYKASEFMEKLEEYEKQPEKVSLNGIVSFETIRSDRIVNRLKEVSADFDLVIVDEAHHMRNVGRKQWKAGTVLSQNAMAMVMLTATPVQLGRENLFVLLQILDNQEFRELHAAEERFSINENIVMAQNVISNSPHNALKALNYLKTAQKFDVIRENPYLPRAQKALECLNKAVLDNVEINQINKEHINVQRELASLNLISHIYTRTRKRDVNEDFTRREAHPIIIEFTAIERAFYSAVTNYVRSVSARKGQSSLIEKWVLNTPQRRMASSIPAMVEYYKKELFGSEQKEFYSNIQDDIDVEFSELISENDENNEEPEEIPTVEEARENLKNILMKWPKNSTDSKYDALSNAIKTIRDKEKLVKIVIFSFFKGTLHYLYRKLSEEGINSVLITGDVKGEDRVQKIEEFKTNPKIEVMLSSKVGTEGLDFQFCHILFNYDLPWNPMEVEQRIGRLDRIGQESDFIAVYHFWIKGTIEERILKRLYERIGIFEKSIGELELILGEISSDLEYELFARELSPEEEQAALDRKLRVIEARQQELQEIEKDAARFIGTDAFFEQEVEKFRRNRLFITPEQIRSLVDHFIRNVVPQTRINYDKQADIGRIFPGEDLIKILANEDCLKEMRGLTSTANGREITFNSEVAFKYPKIEFVNLLHPLIKAIVGFYSKNSFNSSQSHFICLASDELEEGYYFFFTHIVEVRAARDNNLLQAVIINDYGEEACDADKAEYIFGEMLENGKSSITPPPRFDAKDMESIYKEAESIIRKRVSDMKENMQIANDVFVDRRIQVINSFYTRILDQKNERLANYELTQNQNMQYLRMLKGDIRNRKLERENEIEKTEKRRRVSLSFRPLCFGCLRVNKS